MFSPRSAKTFASLVDEAKLTRTCARLVAFCISSATVEALTPLTFARVAVAGHPIRTLFWNLFPYRSPSGSVAAFACFGGLRLSETGNLSKPQVDAPTAPPRVRRKPAFAVFFGLAIVALLAGAGFFVWQQMAHRLAIEPKSRK
jgi:hypothetical protein